MTTYAKRKLKYSRNENFNLLHYVEWDRIVTSLEQKRTHCVQTDLAKNVWTPAYLIPERNWTVRRQEEGKNSVIYLFFA